MGSRVCIYASDVCLSIAPGGGYNRGLVCPKGVLVLVFWNAGAVDRYVVEMGKSLTNSSERAKRVD